jgi:predicted kinase
MKAKVATKKPLLVLLYGYPGSGKTHFSNEMTKLLQCAHVHGDRIRHELFEDPQFDEQENAIVTQLMEYMTQEFLSAGVSVIYDYTTIRKSQRRSLRELARKQGVGTVTVWFQMDMETASKRLNDRDRRRADDKYAVNYTPEMFEKYVSHMQAPDSLDNYIVVSGKHTFPSQQTSFFKKLAESGYIDTLTAKDTLAKPGMINLVPSMIGRVDMSRRNINIR